MKKSFSSLLLLFFNTFLFAQSFELDYYLPNDVVYNEDIPKPSDVIGYDIGELHLSHDKLVYYLKQLAEKSDRISIEEYGQTYEKRPLLLLKVSSPENLNQLDTLRKKHLQLSAGHEIDSAGIAGTPLVVWMGYSVHGNEASGSNAVPLLAYYLAAAEGTKIEELLNNTVILIDACINPDGFQRFANWANQHYAKNPSYDKNNQVHEENWPKGRTNHYWFDLNRDWLLLQQPESKARIKLYHDWKPNILTDHHEMGSDKTLFFQPGVPSRQHPLTPNKNFFLTRQIAEYNARALDREKELYYTQQDYDDFYYGKGSTYPDLNGGIGILFEQGSTRGFMVKTENGIVTFPETIKNQLTVSLATLEGGLELKNDLLQYQNEFYTSALDLAKKNTNQAYIIEDKVNPQKVRELADILTEHDITLYKPVGDITANDKTFNPESSFIIPLNQPQHRLIKALFEKRTEFTDSIFYDISAWSMDLAFNVDFEALNEKNIASSLAAERLSKLEDFEGELAWKSKYAYAISWNNLNSPSVLYALLEKDLLLKVATEEFYDIKGKKYPIGTILLPLGIQNMSSDDIYDYLTELVDRYRVNITPLETGFTTLGVDLGSPSFETLKIPRLLLLAGEQVNAYEAGEIWHLLDQKIDIPVTMVAPEEIGNVDLFEYTHLIMPDGNYNDISHTTKEYLNTWLNNGGIILGQNGALPWLVVNNMLNAQLKTSPALDLNDLPYSQVRKLKGSEELGGAIFSTNIDTSHPLCYGYYKPNLPVFKEGKISLEKSDKGYNNPLVFGENPLLAGYVSENNKRQISNSSALIVSGSGKGKVIGFAFNPNFRAFWYGTERIFLNSIFFSSIIRTR